MLIANREFTASGIKRLACLMRQGCSSDCNQEALAGAEWWEGTNRDASKFNK